MTERGQVLIKVAATWIERALRHGWRPWSAVGVPDDVRIDHVKLDTDKRMIFVLLSSASWPEGMRGGRLTASVSDDPTVVAQASLEIYEMKDLKP